MRTVGIDLAAQDRATAVAVLDWGDDHDDRDGTSRGRRGVATLVSVRVGWSDADLVALAGDADVIGVDCPFGWPTEFVEMVAAHAAGTLRPPDGPGSDWRRRLTLRVTDRHVHARTGITPMRVSADLIAHLAMRWAAVAARLAQDGHDVRRDGSGLVVETYPAAALRLWQLPSRGYKGTAGAAVRAGLVAALLDRLPGLDVAGHRDLLVASDHALDALVCALLARAVRLGLTEAPSDSAAAGVEGWIHLPTGPPEDLAPGS